MSMKRERKGRKARETKNFPMGGGKKGVGGEEEGSTCQGDAYASVGTTKKSDFQRSSLENRVRDGKKKSR